MELDCKVEHMNANQGIMPEAHNIGVQYMQSEENDLNNTFQLRIPFFLHYIAAALHLIRSSKFRTTSLPEKRYWPFLSGSRTLNNEY